MLLAVAVEDGARLVEQLGGWRESGGDERPAVRVVPPVDVEVAERDEVAVELVVVDRAVAKVAVSGVRSTALSPQSTCSETSVKLWRVASGPASKETMNGGRAN